MGYEREMSARQKALELVKKRDAIEAEMDAIISTLTTNGGPGRSGNLVDSEGFPRADIDVHAVRSQRNRFAMLKTDHKAISAEIEKYLHIALAPPSESERQQQAGAPAASSSSQPLPDGPSSQSGDAAEPPAEAPAQPERPSAPIRPAFALTDMVTDNSPAAAAGLLVNDRIVSFGAVSLRAFATPQLAMAALPGLLREHENQPIDVIVRRGEDNSGELVTLNLIPRRWSGPGLLGCHIVPLEVSQVDEHYAPDVVTAVMNHTGRGIVRP